MHLRPNFSSKANMNESCSTQKPIQSSWASIERRDYLTHLNHNLINELNDVETEKHFYKNKLSNEARSHYSELQESFRVISEKNLMLLEFEERIARKDKENRLLTDDFVCLKNNYEAQKDFAGKEIVNIKEKCQQKIQKIQEELQIKFEAKLAKRINEVQQDAEDRLKLSKEQNQQLGQNSRKLLHQLNYVQEQYRQMLLKNDTIIQESIHRELRKRDFQSQNNYLRDLAQFQSVKKQRNQLKERFGEIQESIEIKRNENSSLKAQLEAQLTKVQNLEDALQNQTEKNEKKVEERALRETTEFQTNTEQPFVPIILPVDTNLIAEIVSIKEFVVEKIIQRFLDFYCKTAVTDPKKRSFSLTAFKNSLSQLAEANPQNKILLFIQSSLERVVKVYCPAMSYSRDYLTVKDDFIKRVLMECETISNPTQKLYRLLQLLHRLKHPVNHLRAEVSNGELKLLQIKILVCLKKILG